MRKLFNVSSLLVLILINPIQMQLLFGAIGANRPIIAVTVYNEYILEGGRRWQVPEGDVDIYEGPDYAEFRLYQTGDVIDNVTVYYKLSGTAKSGIDYGWADYEYSVNDSITFNTKMTSINIYMVDDRLREGTEKLKMTLIDRPEYDVDPDNSYKTVYILDNELPDVQFLNPSSFGKESISPIELKVVLSSVSSVDVQVNCNVSGIMATSGEDYKCHSSKLIIPAGLKETTLLIEIIDDTIIEDEETLLISLQNPRGANIGVNEKHYYTIINEDGPAAKSLIYDKIYGIILGSRAGSSMGAYVESLKMEAVEEGFGFVDDFHEYFHYGDAWAHPAGGTEDGIERQKLMCTTIIEKQDRITANDLLKTWVRECELNDMYHLTQPYDRMLMLYAKWGINSDSFPKTKYGIPYDLGRNIHLTARVFHALPCINAGDPAGVIEDMQEIGRLYYEDPNDDAFKWGAVYNVALTLAMLPGATVNSVIEDALEYATQEIKTEINYGLAIADKYLNPMDRGFRKDLNAMYADPSSPYYANERMRYYTLSSIYENVTCAFAIFKLTGGNLEQSVIVATNRGRDTDCTAASAGGLAGAFSGTTTISNEWISKLEEGTRYNPYTNSHMTNRATADGLYRALQNKLRKMDEHIRSTDEKYGSNISSEANQKIKYLRLMKQLGVY